MGITIHYQGQLKSTKLINRFKEEIMDISRIMKWKWQVLDEDWSYPATAQLSSHDDKLEIIGHLPLKGIQIEIHPECEPLSLFFNAEGKLMTPILMVLINEGKITDDNLFVSVKTQFAPPDVHISIIKLLRYLKKRYILNLKVIDEGDYWDTDDKQKLIEKMTFLQDKIEKVSDIFASMDLEKLSQFSSEQLAKILGERLKKKS